MFFLRSDYLPRGELAHVLAALTPPNRLACEVSLYTGLRISDVLNLRTEQLSERFTVRESKTGKNKRVRLSPELLDRCISLAGKIFVFEGRTDRRKARTRAAVYKDLKRAARLFRLDKRLQISPHTCRKVYAVDKYRAYGCDIKKLQSLLNHSDEAVTMLYAMADALTSAKMGDKNAKVSNR